MHYFAKIIKEDNVYLVSFPELPNVNTYGATLQSAIANAAEALNGTLESDFERGFSLPEFIEYNEPDFYAIPVSPHLEIAYTLRKLRENKSQVEIARALGISYQAYQKLENPRKCNPTIKTLEKISTVLGRKLEVQFS
ncbi:MAG: type II toxin-antitoxin system HicB family antitoxin [Candidatus Marinimicrobia bacterium]|nr:type II toxin-antitoxin system HicB family antitoxin [Candidatus Neomarinimicrobiota bacterium]